VLLLLVFLMMLLGLFALFLGGGLVAQGYLYQNPAERMPLRALAGALLVAGFVTFWVWVDQRAPGRYDTFFNFAPYSTVEFDEFEAVRWMGAGGKLTLGPDGKPAETTAKFKKVAGGKGAQFVEEGTGNAFEPRGSTSKEGQYMTGAIRVKGPDDPEPVRYDAELSGPKERPIYKEIDGERRFKEQDGSRYVKMNQPGILFVPSTGTVALALLLNFALVVVWLAAFWPILRFSLGHALIFTGACALLMMLTVMPVLFKQNRVEKPKEPAAALVWREGAGPRV
jgi:hypothetical protein